MLAVTAVNLVIRGALVHTKKRKLYGEEVMSANGRLMLDGEALMSSIKRPLSYGAEHQVTRQKVKVMWKWGVFG